MGGAAMSLKAAASGFVIFLLSVSAVQGQNGWGVTYHPAQICALKGSTVEIHSTFTYPSRGNNHDTKAETTLWFTKGTNNAPVALSNDSDYTGRVQSVCDENDCTLRITDLRESDSVVYKFRFITNQPYTGLPGVSLSVTANPDLHVQAGGSSNQLECYSSCYVPDHSSYVWYKNGQKMDEDTASLALSDNDSGNYSCAVKGREDYRSPAVYVPKLPSVSVCPSGKIREGSSVTLSCSSDANPAVTYTWYKKEENPDLQSLSKQPLLVFSSIQTSDSGEYHCMIQNTLARRTSGSIFINVKYAPKPPSVSVSPSAEIVEDRSVTLSCYSYANPAANYTWYKRNGNLNLQPLSKERLLVFSSIQSSDSGEYYCKAENELDTKTSKYISISVTYAPKLPSVSVSPSAEIVEGSSVTLTCSSDANPAATYTWYKRNGKPNLQPLSKEPQLVFSSIQSSDSGEYHCTAENKLGTKTSKYISISVTYGPKLPSVSVSPSAEIVEGSSVTLTCSSDANPAATYTWYKENQKLLQGREGIYRFTSISSEDRGTYGCKSENQHGENNSSSLFINVQYAPKPPSVSVSPSAEIVEGRSVNLTCSSDANPAANYTWYKESEETPKALEQILTITNIRAEHSGNYYCEAQNRRGRHNATLHLIVVAGAWKLIVASTVPVIFLTIILIPVFLWIIKRRASKHPSGAGERPDDSEQIQPAEQQDDFHYASVRFSRNQTDPIYSNIRPAQPQRYKEKRREEETVDYAAVTLNSASTAWGTRRQEGAEDPAALYSTINKLPNKHRQRNL